MAWLKDSDLNNEHVRTLVIHALQDSLEVIRDDLANGDPTATYLIDVKTSVEEALRSLGVTSEAF